jgi:hypothetical protein
VKLSPLSTIIRLLWLAGLLVLLLTLSPGSAMAGEDAPEWVSFFSSNTTFHGEPVRVGSVISALDPQGVECGRVTVTTPGQFPVLACLRDDPTTPDIDEGPEPGEPISFEIDGVPAQATPIEFNFSPVSPTTVITWTSRGDVWKVELRVPPPPPRPVGGYGEPLGVSELLGPWLIVASVAAIGPVLAVVLGRRTAL